MHLSFSPFQNELLERMPLELRFKANGLELSFLQGFTQGRGTFEGKLFADITLQNTLQDLQGDGPINITRGKVGLPDLGTAYHDLNGALRLRNKEVVIDEFNNEEPGAHQLKYYAPGVGNVRVGWRGDATDQENLELVKFEQLSAEELAKAREAALKLEQNAYEGSKEAYGPTPRAERVGTGAAGQ
jgi:hypothetical protein